MGVGGVVVVVVVVVAVMCVCVCVRARVKPQGGGILWAGGVQDEPHGKEEMAESVQRTQSSCLPTAEGTLGPADCRRSTPPCRQSRARHAQCPGCHGCARRYLSWLRETVRRPLGSCVSRL
jgi:hypothetical protein